MYERCSILKNVETKTSGGTSPVDSLVMPYGTIKIMVSQLLPPDTIMVSPDLKKYFDAAINNDTEEMDKQRTELLKKVGIITNLLNKA